ncbi:hypothetical protein OTU49_001713, partial [Cherax quadricarinatus]
ATSKLSGWNRLCLELISTLELSIIPKAATAWRCNTTTPPCHRTPPTPSCRKTCRSYCVLWTLLSTADDQRLTSPITEHHQYPPVAEPAEAIASYQRYFPRPMINASTFLYQD